MYNIMFIHGMYMELMYILKHSNQWFLCAIFCFSALPLILYNEEILTLQWSNVNTWKCNWFLLASSFSRSISVARFLPGPTFSTPHPRLSCNYEGPSISLSPSLFTGSAQGASALWLCNCLCNSGHCLCWPTSMVDCSLFLAMYCWFDGEIAHLYTDHKSLAVIRKSIAEITHAKYTSALPCMWCHICIIELCNHFATALKLSCCVEQGLLNDLKWSSWTLSCTGGEFLAFFFNCPQINCLVIVVIVG